MLEAQQTLSLDDAIALALKNNYAITISKNDAEINKNNASYGNAGFLPTVSFLASGSLANNNTKQNYSSGLEVNKSGVGSSNINSGVSLNWTLFDGMKMFATYDRLRVLNDMGLLQSKITIESTVASIINAYYNVVQQKQLIALTDTAIRIYEERVKISEMKLNIGSGSKLDLLQAKVDLNEQRSLRLNQQKALSDAKTLLNKLLSRAPGTELDVNDSIRITYVPKLEDLERSVMQNNNSILFSQQNVNVNNYLLAETRSLYYPHFGVNLNYNFTESQNQAGFVLLNRNLGFNAGFTASWTIFNGFNTSRMIKNAKISSLNSQLSYEQTKTEVNSELMNAFTNFKNAMELLQLEEDNFSIASENVNVALESFRIGKTSSLELKTAQTSFENARSRLVSARYQAKIAETELLRLNGMLVR
jgi:outer membrane protein TolC